MVQESADTGEKAETAVQTAREQLEHASDYADVEEAVVTRLKYPTTVLTTPIPVKRDDGSVDAFMGYRAQHDDVRGPYKGGIRYHPDVTESECVGLAMWMT
ncbi:Glu/Leu/Phe/Val dehydrogenase dimerization domain-containing protein [Natronomonas pharaonis]|uniref:Glu/Leu/Phe/Val dehydrogenase dimerization domain-containing protein n=1 Tax=Natronomonas pharaonis TaxID=2257 RepID=UPI00373AF2F5